VDLRAVAMWVLRLALASSLRNRSSVSFAAISKHNRNVRAYLDQHSVRSNWCGHD
jgi:hypothetical protein